MTPATHHTSHATSVTTLDTPNPGHPSSFSQHTSQGQTPKAALVNAIMATAVEKPDPYKTSVEVIGRTRKKRFYPLVPVQTLSHTNAQYAESFQTVQSELNIAVHGDRDLQQQARFVLYFMFMCGRAPEKLLPFVIIFAELDNIYKLRKLFNNEALATLNCREDSVLFRMFGSEYNGRFPPFVIVYQRTSRPPVNRLSGENSILGKLPSSGMLCGSLLRCGERFATLGPFLDIGSNVLGLTVEHLFEDNSETLEDTTAGFTVEDPSYTNSNIVESGGMWVEGDDDYDYMENCNVTDLNNPDEHGLPIDSDGSPGVSSNFSDADWRPIGQRYYFVPAKVADQPFLDYALIEVPSISNEQVNVFLPISDSVEPICMERWHM